MEVKNSQLALQKDLIRRFITAYEKHDLEAVWRMFDPNGNFLVLRRYGIEPTFENYRSFMARFISAFPDVRHHIEAMVAEGDSVWVNYTITGTHMDNFRNIPATHKSVRYSLIAMYRISDGKITDADFLSDDLNLMKQLKS